MLKEKWSSLVQTNALCGFLDTLLRGYGQIVFCNTPLTGLIALVGFLDSPVAGILALLGSISSLVTAIWTGSESSLVKSGLFGCNGALIGLAFAIYLPVNLLLVVFMVVASILSALLMRFLLNTMSVKLALPVASIPFLVFTWLSLLLARYMPGDLLAPHVLPQFLVSGQIEQALLPHLPESLSTILHIMSGVFFQNSIFIGLLTILGMLIYSRISPIFGLLGGILGILLCGLMMPTGPDYAKQWAIGFNCALISIALGGFFIRLTWQSIIYALLGTSVGAVIGLALYDVLSMVDIPPLASPFSLVTLLFLYALRVMPEQGRRVGLEGIPLVQTGRPEANLDWRSWVRGRGEQPQVRLSLPFYGTWYVSSGNNGQPTHSGGAAYAWDFIVLDERKKSYRTTGAENEDYYCFGLPVLAPAPGIVVKVNDSVPSNKPYRVNRKQSWGNYVIIDHGNNEFSEISHFEEHSIVVKEGDKVVRGQLLGHCGNSGLSLVPHIHYQLQSEAVLGADTVPIKFHDYVVDKGWAKTKVKQGIPREKESVSNANTEIP